MEIQIITVQAGRVAGVIAWVAHPDIFSVMIASAMNRVEGQENTVCPALVAMVVVCRAIPDILGRIVNATPKFQIQSPTLTTVRMNPSQILMMQQHMQKLVHFLQKLQELF